MSKQKKVIQAVMAVMLVSLLAFSVYAAGYASASSTSAYASVSTDDGESHDLAAVARLGNALGWTGDSKETYGKSLSASGSASDLPGYPDVPVQSSRASAWLDNECVDEDYWNW